LCDSRNNRLVILHNGPVADVKTRPFWSRSCTWDQFESLGKITVITKWLSECAVEDLNPFFDK
jgi:hypothetical protein